MGTNNFVLWEIEKNSYISFSYCASADDSVNFICKFGKDDFYNKCM